MGKKGYSQEDISMLWRMSEAMRTEYLEALQSSTEETIQDFITEAHQNEGWSVKNVHKKDRRHERGADLIAKNQGKRRLIAMKKKPGKGDLKQLEMLHSRKKEGELLYAYVEDPSEPFRKEMEAVEGDIRFLGPSKLHSLLVHGESIDYMVEIFSRHSLSRELSTAIGITWRSRSIEPPQSAIDWEDAKALWVIKDAVLKVRSSLGVVVLRWEDKLMKRKEMEPTTFEEILDSVLEDLDYVQRFTGGGLVGAFGKARGTRPHILSQLWSSIRNRTSWIDFTLKAEEMGSEVDVAEAARRFWVVPGTPGWSPHTGVIRGSMKGFYSGIVGILKNLGAVAEGFDRGVELAWLDARTDSYESIYGKPRNQS
jgi:hypothetical protein